MSKNNATILLIALGLFAYKYFNPPKGKVTMSPLKLQPTQYPSAYREGGLFDQETAQQFMNAGGAYV